MTLAIWAHGLGGVAYIAFGWRLALSMTRQHVGGLRFASILGVAVLSALWSGLEWAYALTGAPALGTGAMFADVLRFGGWYAFLLSLIQPGRRDSRAGPIVNPWLPAIAVAMVVLGLVILAGMTLRMELPGDLQHLRQLHMLGMAVLALVLLEQLYRNVATDWLWSVKPLCLGLAAAFLFDLYLFSDGVMFGQLDHEANSMRGAAHGVAVPLLALSLSRSFDWISRIRVSQKAMLHTASLVLAGVYFLFISAVGYYVRYFGGEWGRALQMALVFSALVVLGGLACSGSLRSKLRVLVRKHFFRYRYDYREEWLRFTRCLSASASPREMGQQVIRGLADMLESPAGGLWLKEFEQPFFTQAAAWNLAANAAREDDGSPLCSFLARNGWVVNLEEMRCFRKRYDGLELPEWLAGMPNAWLIVPLMLGDDLFGFVILTSARTRLDVDWEINDLLKTAGRQAAGFLAQMQATEALLEVRKFDAFNRMSAFVVHDLKNVVAQLSLLLRNAERHRDNPEFQRDMLLTIANSVERMRQLMLQLRDGDAPVGASCGVDLAKVIGRIQADKAAQGRAIGVDMAERLMIRGHEQRIERVVGHLVQNAIDATDPSGQVWISLERQGGQARIEIGDTGQGMSREFQREHLFKPFQTTKQAGMGIGAYESFLYVQELGGKILVDSEVGKGTRVSLILPILDAGMRTEFRQQEAA